MARGRDRKGRFLKRGTAHRSRSSTAIVRVERARSPARRRSSAVVVRERVSVARRGGGRRHHGDSRTPIRVKAELAGWASVLGYLETTKSDLFDKVPTFGSIPREAIIGGVLHFVGKRNKHIDRAAAAALTVAGYKLGAGGFKLSGDYDE
jgi:hypothetical protein